LGDKCQQIVPSCSSGPSFLICIWGSRRIAPCRPVDREPRYVSARPLPLKRFTFHRVFVFVIFVSQPWAVCVLYSLFVSDGSSFTASNVPSSSWINRKVTKRHSRRTEEVGSVDSFKQKAFTDELSSEEATLFNVHSVL